MTQVEKELLLRDLAHRLPYGVFVHTDFDGIDYPIILKGLSYDGEYYAVGGHYVTITGILFSKHPCKPYLRPLSSMTEAERKLWDIVSTTKNDLHYLYTDFLDSHYLDYRGLIPKGFALEAPEGMYNY